MSIWEGGSIIDIEGIGNNINTDLELSKEKTSNTFHIDIGSTATFQEYNCHLESHIL